MNDTIKIKHPQTGKPMTVAKADYIKAKTKDLQAFGYPDLTEDDVTKQLEAALSHTGMDIIGYVIEKDLIQPSPETNRTDEETFERSDADNGL